jgi:hypothetical protein
MTLPTPGRGTARAGRVMLHIDELPDGRFDFTAARWKWRADWGEWGLETLVEADGLSDAQLSQRVLSHPRDADRLWFKRQGEQRVPCEAPYRIEALLMSNRR